MTATPNPTPIPVVCALIEREGLILVAQRPAHKHLGGKWEFPGGKVEPGETSEAALAREIREELGCEIEIVRAQPRSLHVYPTLAVEMIPFVARLKTACATLQSHEHSALAWVEPAALRTLDMPEADLPIIEAYLRFA